jgi:Bacteriophage tail assembly protein
VTFHIWTAYSPFTTWVQIVKDWMKTKGDTGKRKTFVNTTLGETWEAKIGERPDAEVMAERKEHYSAPVPDRVAYLTAGIDSQLDRYEMRVWGWGPGEESWLIDRQIIMGRHDDEALLHSEPGDPTGIPRVARRCISMHLHQLPRPVTSSKGIPETRASGWG